MAKSKTKKAAAAKAAAIKAAEAAAIEAAEAAAIEAATKGCFVDGNKVSVPLFTTALQKQNIVTRHKLKRIIETTDYLSLENGNAVVLSRSIFTAKAMHLPRPPLQNMATEPSQNTAAPPPAVNPVQVTNATKPVPPPQNTAAPPPAVNPVQVTNATKPAPPPIVYLAARKIKNTTTPVPSLSVDCDTMAIMDVLGDIATRHLDLEEIALTDIFLDVGSKMSVKINGVCVQFDYVIAHSDISTILEQLPGGGPDFKHSNRVIFGRTLHRLAAVTYDGSIAGITIRVGRSVSGLLPVFEGLVEQKNVLLCGSPNVGKTTTLREICKYLSRGKCLCLIDTSGEVCGETGTGDRGHIVGTSRVFRPVDPAKQYTTLLDCVRNHSLDVIAIDELNTKEEVEVCQTIALRSIQMVASVHGNIQDLVFNSMLNKALGGSTNALVSDRVAIDGRKVVMQRTTRPIFDVVIDTTRTSHGFEYSFIEDVANNVSRIMQGKPIHIRRRRMVGKELLESKEEVLYPCE
ncbi:putative protein ycf45 [Linnemannia hyalina]|uniref:AAA+ ATPase domain-containing protein n=1 Tax=Linnemannia hyalina TaxID=64524 RepID=A0A9P8BR36_9FUNG|nr:putative protein ycf45 [Linnemannia hyalina]